MMNSSSIRDNNPVGLAISHHVKKSVVLPGEPINERLREHEVAAEGWEYSDAAGVLHEWADRFNQVFRLDLEVPAIRIDALSNHIFGTYRGGRNGFGLRHEITLNARHLKARSPAQHLETLLHELIHEWQARWGKASRGNYHNLQFRVMAKRFGLIVDHRGRHLAIEPGLFTRLLEQYGVETRSLPVQTPVAVLMRRRGNSKMVKYRCGCTTVRCAVDLKARCLKCGQAFEEAVAAW